MKAHTIERVSRFRCHAPSGKRGASETSPLKVRLPVVVQAFPDRPENSGSYGVTNLGRSASVIGGRFRVCSDVIDVSVPAVHDGCRDSEITSPQAFGVNWHIVEKTKII